MGCGRVCCWWIRDCKKHWIILNRSIYTEYLFITKLFVFSYPVKYSNSVSVSLVSATPWTAACQASLSITISWSLLKLMSSTSVMPSNHLILCCPLFLLPSIFPSIRSFSMSQFFTSSGRSIGVPASASVLNHLKSETMLVYNV